jgi:hypothetical protein
MSESRPIVPSPASGSQDRRYRLAWWTLVLALIYGGLVRSLWIEDMEWKKDEGWSYHMSQNVGRTLPWPGVGMPTSLEFPNPGLSVWIFVPIGRLVHSPTSMARVIVLLNMVGLVGFAAAVRAYVPAREREPWLWGLALQAVSPFAVRLSRKIWPPSILTPLLLLLWISHRHRATRWGALAWGLVGALIGQVHLSGWFVAAGLVLGTAIAEYRGRLARSRHWRLWLLGSVLGLMTALPWARALPTSSMASSAGNVNTAMEKRIIGYTYSLFGAATGVFPFSFLGLGLDTDDFRIGPMIDGMPTHVNDLMGLIIVLAVAARIVARLIGAIVAHGVRWPVRKSTSGSGSRDGDSSAAAGPDHAGAEAASTGFYLWSTIAIPGVLFLLTTNVYFYHYFFVFCPFLFVLLAAYLLPWRRTLLAVVIAQAVTSYDFLSYIHQKGGTVRGEYYRTYARQVER